MSQKKNRSLDAFLKPIKEKITTSEDKNLLLTKNQETVSNKKINNDKSGAIGFEDKLWKMADKCETRYGSSNAIWGGVGFSIILKSI